MSNFYRQAFRSLIRGSVAERRYRACGPHWTEDKPTEEQKPEVKPEQKVIPIEFDESDCGGVLGADGNVYSDADPGL